VFTPMTSSTDGHYLLQMLSSPYDFTGAGKSLSALLGDVPNPLLAIWQPLTGAYAVTPTTPADTLHRGQGFWIRLKQVGGLVGAPDPQVTTSNFAIALANGWNMVGDPWPTAVNLQNVLVSDASGGHTYTWTQAVSAQVHLVDPVVYSYDPSTNTYVRHFVGNSATASSSDSNPANPTLSPYVGYWFHAYATCSLQVPSP
jgi:hypothetical protein